MKGITATFLLTLEPATMETDKVLHSEIRSSSLVGIDERIWHLEAVPYPNAHLVIGKEGVVNIRWRTSLPEFSQCCIELSEHLFLYV